MSFRGPCRPCSRVTCPRTSVSKGCADFGHVTAAVTKLVPKHLARRIVARSEACVDAPLPGLMASNWSWWMSDSDFERFIVLVPAALCLCAGFQSRFSAQCWGTQPQRSAAGKATHDARCACQSLGRPVLMRTAPQLGCSVLLWTPD